MRRFDRATRAIVTIVVGALLAGGSLAPVARAVTPDPSDVVLVFDFSASILKDVANRTKFATALDAIATRVDETTADLTASDATMSFVQFASSAADVPGCVNLKLLNSPETVAKFADCLRSVAGAYRKGLDANLTKKIGIDTNYVAAMEQAATHIPPDSKRPAMILFTDGKHDVKGVPASAVQPARNRLFGSRTPFALLPVGMGLDPKERGPLTAGLQALRITRDMPACTSGATFEWPTVAFDTPDKAGTAVAQALQDATCTFTVAPTPAPTPPPAPAAVRGVAVTPLDGRIQLTWAAPATSPVAITDYLARCRSGEGDWIESTEGISTERTTTIEGLTNGLPYQCEVATVGATSQGPWVPAGVTVTPIGRPAVPAKPSVEALDKAVQISVPPADPAAVSGFRYECSSDNGATWPVTLAVTKVADPTAQIGNLTNGVEYVCRAFADNAIGASDASPISSAVKPCGGLLDCNGLLAPLLGILGLVLALGLIAVAYALYRERSRRGYVVAVIDVIHTANLGHGSNLGIAFIRAPGSRVITGIAAEKADAADIRVRYLGRDRFSVRDTAGRHIATSGEPIMVVAGGVRHELVLRAFDTVAASQATVRR
jgi:hypothetical protein